MRVSRNGSCVTMNHCEIVGNIPALLTRPYTLVIYFDLRNVGATAINQGIYVEETADWVLRQFGDQGQQNFTSSEIEAAFEWVSCTYRTKIVAEHRSLCNSSNGCLFFVWKRSANELPPNRHRKHLHHRKKRISPV